MSIIGYFLILLGLMFPCAAAGAEDALEQKTQPGEDRLVIRSQSLEMDNKTRTVIFTGDVDARKSSFTIKCRQMHLYYQDDSSGEAEAPGNVKVDRVEATGDVKITRADGGEAMADKAVYYQAEDKIVLTGNPVVKQGEDFVEGSRIIFFIKDRRSIVEGSGQERVRAVIFPGKDKR